MHFSSSLLATATLPSFSLTANAGAAQRRLDKRNASNPAKEHSAWSLGSLLGRRQNMDSLLVDSASWRILNCESREDTQEVYNKLIGPLPPATVTTDYNPGALYVDYTITAYREVTATELVTRPYNHTTVIEDSEIDPHSAATESQTASTKDPISSVSSTGSLDVSPNSSTGEATTIMADGGVVTLPTTSGTTAGPVLALPFSCPEDNGKRITNIVGSNVTNTRFCAIPPLTSTPRS